MTIKKKRRGDTEITINAINEVIRKLKDGKALAYNKIPSEMF